MLGRFCITEPLLELLSSVKTFLVSGFAILALAPSLAHGITLEPESPTRAGLLRIRGTGFGLGGQVRAAGFVFPVARWSDSLIECYVPMAMPLGSQLIQVLPKAGAASGRTFANATVQPAEAPGGRVAWRVKLADQYVSARPAVGPDGTIYAIGNFGNVYAVSPLGEVKWVSPTNAAGTIDILPDGNVVVGGGGGVQALNASNGSRLWTYAINTPLLCGPSVGPDGNVYAADDSRWSNDVIGAFVLSPSGQKLWSGGVFYRRGGGWTPQEVKFAGGNAYFWSDASSTVPAALGGLNAVRIGGGLRWRAEDGVGIMPGAAPNGGVSFFRPSSIDQRDASGSVVWSQPYSAFGNAQPQGEAVVAADGRTYFTAVNRRINVISPTGQVIHSKAFAGMLSDIIVRQDANLVAVESQTNFGIPSEIQGYDKNLNLLWSQALPVENGMTITCYHRMQFNSTGTRLYFGTAGPNTAPNEAHCYLYSINAE
jgi:hypothetical protein